MAKKARREDRLVGKRDQTLIQSSKKEQSLEQTDLGRPNDEQLVKMVFELTII